MRRYKSFAIFLFVISYFPMPAWAQEKLNFKIPSIAIHTIAGVPVNTSSFSNNGKPIIIDFFATWCKPCIMELDAIADKYEYEQKRTGVKIIVISVDSASIGSGKVAKFVRSKGWKYEVYLDPAGDFQKAMNVMDTPATYIADAKGNVVWVHNSYIAGDEDKLFQAIDKLTETK